MLFSLTAWLFCLVPVHAETLKILTTGAFKQVVLEFIPGFEARTGVKVELQNDTAGALIKRISAGETFDVVFLTPGGLSTLADQQKVDVATIRPVAKVVIGVAVKSGAPHPKLETVEQFKEAVLGARKVAYIDPASGGSSGIYLDGLFRRLGIADEVRAKAILVPGGLLAERVANGEADLAIHQVSEILPVPGVSLAGLLPEPIQNATTYSSAVAASANNRPAATGFLAAMASSGADAIIRAKGMQPVK
ncbi:MAG: substrate-binding domain-containing protein [Burkholderiaceae bacterium]|nr:substrate-binding domain-containing protein [Burkholderiaceae bacterium]